MPAIRLGRYNIGESPFIIAEIGVNHNGSVELAKDLISQAKSIGCDAVKFQTYITDEITIKTTPLVDYQKEAELSSQYQLLKSLELKEEDFFSLKEHAEKEGIIFLSTPGDLNSVELLDRIGVPAYKVGSDDLNNLPLLYHIIKKSKPILLSTGMATMDEIEETVMYIEEEWRKENNSSLPLILLHCVSLYPTPKEEANLSAITSLKERFPYPVGYSDHTIGIVAAVAAVSLGAVIIEKHFTLNKNLPGPDHFISSDPQEMRELVEKCKEAAVMSWGTKIKGGSLKERSQISLVRKSIVAKREIKEGELLDESNLGIKRPGYGILPKYLPKLIGKRAKVNIKEDELINWDKVI